MPTQAVTDADFDVSVLEADTPVVVDFWAEWCGDKVKIVKLNIDENQNTAIKYGVRSIPTLIMFKNGEPVDMKVGAAPKSDLDKWISGAA